MYYLIKDTTRDMEMEKFNRKEMALDRIKHLRQYFYREQFKLYRRYNKNKETNIK